MEDDIDSIFHWASKLAVHALHISLIVASKVTIWRDDFVDLRFIVSHAELWSQQVALDVFCHWWPELPWNANSFHVQKEKSWGPQNVPPPYTQNETLEGAIKERCQEWAVCRVVSSVPMGKDFDRRVEEKYWTLQQRNMVRWSGEIW